ncbi:MAG: hypothetical protein OSB63_04375 [Planctomycetota bacterium]|nr:hypothetical protein [Planctomycetota bacterium]
MSDFTIAERISATLRSRRFSMIAAGLIVLFLLLYLIFVSFFFDPFEENLDDTASILPSEVDYFVRWQDMGNHFNEFPELAIWSEVESSSKYSGVKDSGALVKWSRDFEVGRLVNGLSKINGYLPTGLSLKKDFMREFVIAGRGQPEFNSKFKGVIMLRASFKVKAGMSMLNFDFVRDKLPESLKLEDIGGGIYRIPQFELFGFQDAYLGRVKDVLLLSSEKEFLTIANEFDKRGGQDSLARASVFHDNVSAHLGPNESPLEVFFRFGRDSASAPEWPPRNTNIFAEQLFGRLFNLQLLRYSAGYLNLDNGIEMRVGGDTDLSLAKGYQQRWLQGSSVKRKQIEEFASMVPAQSFSFGVVAGEVSNLLAEGYTLVPGDLRSMMESEIARGGDYQNMLHLIESIGSVYRQGVAFSLRENTYEELAGDPLHDNEPIPLFAIYGKVRDMGAYDHLFEYLKLNWANFTGDVNQKVEDVTFAGGAVGTSFVSQVIPGTGEINLLHIPTLNMLVITNSAKYSSEIISTAFLAASDPSAKRRQLLYLPAFKSELDKSPNGAHLFTWFSPQRSRQWLGETSSAAAETVLRQERESAWRSQRPQVAKEMRDKHFGGRAALSALENGQLQSYIDSELLSRDVRSKDRLKELVDEKNQSWLPLTLFETMSVALHSSRRHVELVISAEISE